MSEIAAGDLEGWARLLRREWEGRARSAARDFYVASQPDWEDRRAWEEQGRRDVETFLWQLDRGALARAEVLEIGCGVGRLARHLAPLAKGYTGIDVAPGMIEEARRRCADLGNARFLECDGLGLPPEAGDRRYGLALAASVFIHCPRPVIESLVRSAYAALERGAQLRFQLLADPADPEGLSAGPEVDATRARVEGEARRIESAATGAVRDLIDGHYYMGDAFRFRDVEPFLAGATGGRVRVIRLHPLHVHGWIEKV